MKELAVAPDSIPSEDINYSGYDWQRNHEIAVGEDGIGVLYDYDVSEGMYYVKEIDTPMKNDGDNVWITDKDGKKWNGDYLNEWILPEDGQKLHLKGTVKAHGEYKDEKQTELLRVKVEPLS